MYSDAPYVKWLIGFLFSKISERDISQQGIRYIELVTDESACPTKSILFGKARTHWFFFEMLQTSSQKEMQSEKHLELIINKIDLWSITPEKWINVPWKEKDRLPTSNHKGKLLVSLASIVLTLKGHHVIVISPVRRTFFWCLITERVISIWRGAWLFFEGVEGWRGGKSAGIWSWIFLAAQKRRETSCSEKNRKKNRKTSFENKLLWKTYKNLGSFKLKSFSSQQGGTVVSGANCHRHQPTCIRASRVSKAPISIGLGGGFGWFFWTKNRWYQPTKTLKNGKIIECHMEWWNGFN